MFQDLNLDNADSVPVSIPLHEVNGTTLEQIIKWLTLHKDDPVKMEINENDDYRWRLSDVDEEFVKVSVIRLKKFKLSRHGEMEIYQIFLY